MGIFVTTVLNAPVTEFNFMSDENGANLDSQEGIIRCRIPRLPLNSGLFYFNVIIRDHSAELVDFVQQAGRITVVRADYFRDGRMLTDETCIVSIQHSWEIKA
jgi:hypothetical protein